MAAINGNNYAKNISVPAEQSNAGEVGGVVKCLFDQYTGTPSAADVLSIGKLPKGARILDIVAVGMGAAPTYAKIDSDGASTALAAGDVIASQSLVKITAAGGGYAANPFVFVRYVVD
jgi:hypothetical protein